MKVSPAIKPAENQLTLNFEPGLSERYRCLRDCIASSIYRYGLTNAAIDLDKAAGNLSVELSADPARKFGVDDLEKYIEKSGDLTPIYYLVDKFLKDASAEPDLSEVMAMFKQMVPALKRAGVKL